MKKGERHTSNYDMTAAMCELTTSAHTESLRPGTQTREAFAGLQVLRLDRAAAIGFGPGYGCIEHPIDLFAQGFERIG